MAETDDYRPLRSKRKAITALLPYAVWQERDRQPEMFDIILRAVRASRMSEFMWCYIGQSVRTMFSVASPRAIVLASPHIAWSRFACSGDLVRRWIATASVAPYTEETTHSVVDTLLQVASCDRSSRYITADTWTWLAKGPFLPPVCSGRDVGTSAHVINEVRALKDVEVLKSYLLLVWSEWNGVLSRDHNPSGEVHDTAFNCPFSSGKPNSHLSNTYLVVSCSLCLMQISIREDFGSVGMEHHRADLVHRLDHVLAQLDRGLEYLEQHNPETDADDLQRRKDQYRILRETLLETISRTPHLTIAPLCILTLDGHRIRYGVYVCTPSSIPVVSPLECSVLSLPALFAAIASISSIELAPRDAPLSYCLTSSRLTSNGNLYPVLTLTNNTYRIFMYLRTALL